MSLHPTLVAAGHGKLPEWSRVSATRRKHLVRVADLLGAWAAALDPREDEVLRWRAAGLLHDALRDGDPDEVRGYASAELAHFPDGIVHGPAAAVKLRAEGVDDEDFLRAIAYHTIGHPALESLGRSLYAADFLEPGRRLRRKWRRSLRERMPEDTGPVVREVARAKIGNLLDGFQSLPEETRVFWNVLVKEIDA